MEKQVAESSPTHEVEVNFFYLHYHDARKLAELAEKEKSKLKSLYARHAVLAVVSASEALVNRLLSRLALPKPAAAGIERLGVREKWSLAPFLLTERPDSREWFDISREPFQSFAELTQVRNWLVHPKSGEFVTAICDESSSIGILEKKDSGWETSRVVPWVETLRGGVWKQTKIPFNPFEWTGQHARAAIKVLDDLIEALKGFAGTQLTDWLWEIDLRSSADGKTSKITVESLWGGYTPNE